MTKTAALPQTCTATCSLRSEAACRQCCCLHQMEVGQCARVSAVEGDRELRRRLLEMGFCNGAQVEVIRRAPWGDPIEFSLRGYYVSLREEQARLVKVAPVCA